MRRLAAVIALVVVLGACADRTPAATPSGAPKALTAAQLQYRVVDRFGRLWYCDPDSYPIARGDPDATAEQRFPETQQDADTFAAILGHLGYATSPTYTHAQKVAIYGDWKMLGALRLEPVGDAYRFTARFTNDGRTGTLVDGSIDRAGAISVASQRATTAPPCPICLAQGTRIATPSGSVAVEDLREGMLVWTRDDTGARVAAAVERTGSMTAPAEHQVVHLVLADGRELRASPAHPLGDGRMLGSIAAGDLIDGASVVSAGLEPYGRGITFDLLPSGPTGVYWADGVPLRSTIGR